MERVKSGKIKTTTTFNSDGLKPAEGRFVVFFFNKIVKHSYPVQGASSRPGAETSTAHPVLSP